ncbi:MAG: cytochrome c [Bacteroidetes bacterium]|nr:cytochrome c [Bacteroidota bacterium]
MITISLAACEPLHKGDGTSPASDGSAGGAQLFVDNCARCHQVTGQGGPAPGGLPAPDIRQLTKSPAELRQIIIFGFGKMPSFKDSISDAQISEIADYVAAQIERHAQYR